MILIKMSRLVFLLYFLGDVRLLGKKIHRQCVVQEKRLHKNCNNQYYIVNAKNCERTILCYCCNHKKMHIQKKIPSENKFECRLAHLQS